MSSKKLSEYDRYTIVTWYDNGWYSQRELGDIYGVSRATVRRVIEDSRNFCGRADRPTYPEVGRPTVGSPIGDEAHLKDMVDEYVGLSTLEEAQQKVYTAVVAGLTLALTGFIGWVLYHAAN